MNRKSYNIIVIIRDRGLLLLLLLSLLVVGLLPPA